MNTQRQDQYVVLQQAAAWYARLRCDEVSELDRRKWQVWLEQNAEHRTAWGLVEKVGGRFAHFHDPSEKAGAYKALQASQALPMTRRKTLLSMAVLAVGAAAGWKTLEDSAMGDSLSSLWADYSTGTGEMREVHLKDGSPLWLNTSSAVNATFSSDTRRLQLLSGEILFDGTRAPVMNTVVRTRQGQVISRDAAFSVRLLGHTTCVTVYSGELHVTTQDRRCVVPPGQQITFESGRLGSLQAASASARSWVTGVFVAEGISLQRFVDELSRYRHGYLACDPQVANLRVVGTFSLKDTDRALGTLAASLPVSINRTLSWWVTVDARV